jgi:hypothetical protein
LSDGLGVEGRQPAPDACLQPPHGLAHWAWRKKPAAVKEATLQAPVAEPGWWRHSTCTRIGWQNRLPQTFVAS